MSADYGAWVLLLEVLQQLKKGELLLGCASVLRTLVVSGASTDIAHANGVGCGLEMLNSFFKSFQSGNTAESEFFCLS